MPDLLLELFSEEIPARMQARAAEDLRRLVTDGLVERGLTYSHAAAYPTPRRLALALSGLSARSPDRAEERRGPRADAPEAAVEGFLRGAGLARDQLELREVKKAQVFFARIPRPGRPAAEIVAETVEAVVRGFPWPKSMRWGDGALRWVRPLQAILCILTDEAGAEVVPFEIDGIRSGDRTRGHRFMAPAAFAVTSFDDYAARLQRAHVLLDPAQRAAKIWHDATQLAFAQGLEVVEDPALLAEIAGLVEWPVVLLGRIDPRFLDLPPEVLQTSMRTHQKFLSLRNPATGRIEGYIATANRETADDGATILAGNARVLAARLTDAQFFWETDLGTPLDEMVAKLDRVTFHNKLGTQAERIGRIAAIAAREIAPCIRANLDPALVESAALLAKADLVSQMVYEFPELQGIMGRYYAEKAGKGPEVAAAAREHYAPLGPSDPVPASPVSAAVALADKLDILVGFWVINERPTGSRDPYALRRAALGVVRILLDRDVRIRLNPTLRLQLLLVRNSIARTGESDGTTWDELRSSELVDDLLNFLADRLKVHLRDQGIRHDVIDAAFQLGGQDDLVLLVARVRALQTFLSTEDGAKLLGGYKRANNILTAEEKKDGVEYSLDPDPRLAETDAERALFAALDTAETALTPALEAEDFAAAMTALAALRAPIDGFFDTTTVNADSPILRRNRLCLLHRIRAVMNRVAMFSAVEGG